MTKATEAEHKTLSLSFRIRPSIKALAERRAREEGRSLANYIEWLVQRDAQRAEEAARRPWPLRP
jgi:predicted HicB family RNase H-like nuclease